MVETSRSQPLRKRPRGIGLETQPETQGEANANRCSLLSIIRIVKETDLNDQHIASLKRTPFWLLFDAIISKKLQSDQCRKYDEVVLKIVQSYEEDTEAFTVGSKNIKFTSDHVRLVFGICCGNKEMTETKIKKESTALAKRLEIKESRLSTTTIERKIKELQKSMKQEDIDDVVRLLCLYLCVMLLFSNKANSVNWSYVHYMEDLEKVKEYDWASAVSKYLLESIHKNHRDISQLKGSSILLLYFLCEHTNLVEVKTANGVPRLLKWKISDLRKSLKDFTHLSQLADDKVHNTNLEETADEKKIFGALCAIDGGKREFCGQQQHEEVQPMLTDNDTEATAALVLLGKKEDEICEEEEHQKYEIHVDEQDEICGHHGDEVQVSAEQKQNEVKVCTEQEKDEVEGNLSNLYGLNDFNSSSQPSLHLDSFGTTQETDSGTTLVPNTLSTEEAQETDSGTTLVPNTLEQPSDHAIEVIDKLKKQIETLQQEKKNLEIENMEIRQKNEEALKSHKDEIEKLNSKLEEAQGTNQELNMEFEAKIEDYEVHQITQNYHIETESEVHQVTQQATANKIKRLQKEKEELENELLSIIVHQVTQDYAPKTDAKGKAKKQESPTSRILRVKERDDRKKVQCEDFVYLQPSKRRSPQIIDLETYQVYQEKESKSRKLKRLGGQTDMTELINTKAWAKIQQLWKEGKANAAVWHVASQILCVEVSDIQNLLFEDPLSSRVMDSYAYVLMQDHLGAQPRFDLSTPQPKSFIFPHYLRLMIENKSAKQVNQTLQKQVDKALPARFFLFPILFQAHWTLLVLDKEQCNWKFYNPLRVRHGTDGYCGATDNLRKVIAEYINSQTRQMLNIKITEKVEIVKNSPQQSSGSVDCGIVVISIMKKYMKNESQTSAITTDECRQIRAHLIHTFLK
ncbi:hypothetical protein Vadar_004062 [Vaccinium darrowii]|uniref:Uncharacterized protein n=1 Tax=Vaccinium darrowii TaxID=229202 RepID=A0ACB7WXI8_9ERIC|nr:hypothetical protein Vadar_004062 [Vaccinium darrowii]